MGAQASTAINKINNEVLSESYSKCPKVSASNTADLLRIEHDPNPSCTSSQFKIDQNSAVDANCVLTNMQDSLAAVIAGTSAKVQGGFGIGASTSLSDIKNIIKNKIEQDCGDEAAINAVKASDIKSRACDFLLIQNSNAKTTCQLASAQKTALDVKSKVEADTTGFLGGFGGILVIIVALVIAGGGFALYMRMRNKKGDGEMTNSMDDMGEAYDSYDAYTGDNENQDDQTGGLDYGSVKKIMYRNSFSIITITLLLLVLLFSVFSTKDKKITEEDLDKFGRDLQNVSEIYAKYQIRNEDGMLPEFERDNFDSSNKSLEQFYEPLLTMRN